MKIPRPYLFLLTLIIATPLAAQNNPYQPTPTPTVRPRIVGGNAGNVAATPTPAPRNAPIVITAPSAAATPTPALPAPSPVIITPNNAPPATTTGATTLPPATVILGGTVAPTPMPVIFAPPRPMKPLAYGVLRARMSEALRVFRSRPVPTSINAGALFYVTVAALEPDTNRVHLINLPKTLFLTRNAEAVLTTSYGREVQFRVLRANGVNTAVMIYDETGKQFAPLVVEYPVERGGKLYEVAYYISAHPAILTRELVAAGQDYIHTQVDAAAKRLRAKGFFLTPQIVDIAERLCMVEHVDHQRFKLENRVALYDEIFSLFALNEGQTYRYAVSTAGAGGIVQMIPSTYRMIRGIYPTANLHPDFVVGMQTHANALEAMLLYMNMTWNMLSANEDVQNAIATGIATQAQLMAAGYNSNPAKLPGYLRKTGVNWKFAIPRETQMYLQIYANLESLVPMRPRT